MENREIVEGSKVYIKRNPSNDTGCFREEEGQYYYVVFIDSSAIYNHCVYSTPSRHVDKYMGWFSKEELTLVEEESKVVVINPTKPIIEVTNTAEELEEMFQKAITTTQKSEYLRFHENVCKQLVEITAKKNADYTGINDNPFANFTSVEQRGITSTEQGFLVRMNDKFERIISFVDQGDLQVKEESVSDTLMDLANYCILFMGYLNQKKSGDNN